METVRISLTPETLALLFPEGSEARLHLQRSVLKQVAGQYLKGSLPSEMRSEITEIAEAVVKEVDLRGIVEEFFYRNPNSVFENYTVADGSNASTALKNAAVALMDSLVKVQIDKKCSEIASQYMLKLDGMIESRITQYVTSAARAQLDDVTRRLTEALAATAQQKES